MLESFPGGSRSTNPYLVQLVDSLRALPGVQVDTFSWRRAILGRYDVLHVHWPERFARGESPLGTAWKRMRLAALLLRLATGRPRVVRTLHNLASHEPGDALERVLLGALERRTALRIRLNPYTPVPDGTAVRTILHGHYQDRFPPPSAARAPEPGRLLFFGLLRPYKGVEELLAAFAAVRDAATLRIAGSGRDAALLDVIRRAEREDPRVSARLEYVPDEALADELAAAQLVVLPYAKVHNSGAALLALSLTRPVLMPDTDTTRWLQDEVGPGWVHLYPPPLSPDALRAALDATAVPPAEAPDLRARDWPAIAAAHLEAFLAAAGR